MKSSFYINGDKTIRQALLRSLQGRRRHVHSSIIVEEFGIEYGRARIDLAVIDSKIHGYEIKSDGDSLERLSGQITAYGKALDRVTLVVGYRHAYRALHAVPDWWGVKLVSRGPRGGIRFETARSAHSNPNQDAISVARLLWRSEALAILEENGLASGMRMKTRDTLCRELADSLDISSLMHPF